MTSPSRAGTGGDQVRELFDRSDEYEEMLERGLRLTGEGRDYFVRGRIDLLQDVLPAGFAPGRVLDFGCGTGETTVALAEAFPASRVVGADTAPGAIEHAAREYGGPLVEFCPVREIAGADPFDLCYVNGVFHHIHPAERAGSLGLIRDHLRPGAPFAFFENNPWNPGTRMVMRRIPFDRDARKISPRAACGLLRENGFEIQGGVRYLFFFPASLARLRSIEPFLRSVPLGGQYLVLCRARGGSGV